MINRAAILFGGGSHGAADRVIWIGRLLSNDMKSDMMLHENSKFLKRINIVVDRVVDQSRSVVFQTGSDSRNLAISYQLNLVDGESN
mgnify:FL=1